MQGCHQHFYRCDEEMGICPLDKRSGFHIDRSPRRGTLAPLHFLNNAPLPVYKGMNTYILYLCTCMLYVQYL